MEAQHPNTVIVRDPESPRSLWATIVSYIFHPVFVPMMVTFVIFYFLKTEFVALNNKAPLWLGIVAVNTIVFPLLTVFLLKGLNFVGSITLPQPKDRIIPLIGTMIYYFWAYQVFKNLDAPFFMRVFFLGIFYGIIAVFMTNIFFKVSMHTAGMGGAIGIFLLLLLFSGGEMMIPFIGTLMIAGLVGSARMRLGAHISFEIWLGYVIGILSQMVAYWFLS